LEPSYSRYLVEFLQGRPFEVIWRQRVCQINGGSDLVS
jgi:hypothetical protein